jgi:hypothetical protein
LLHQVIQLGGAQEPKPLSHSKSIRVIQLLIQRFVPLEGLPPHPLWFRERIKQASGIAQFAPNGPPTVHNSVILRGSLAPVRGQRPDGRAVAEQIDTRELVKHEGLAA